MSTEEDILPSYPFILMAAASFISFFFAVKYAIKYSTFIAFILPPFICIFIMYDNIIMAATNASLRRNKTTDIMLVLHAAIIPMILITCYEVAYLVHKRRSVNFCGITFDSGHRARRKDLCSNFLRFSIWIISIALVVLNLIVNFQWIEGVDPARNVGLYDVYDNVSIYVSFSLIPSLIVVAFSLYIGVQLWKYGTYYSFMIHATYFNPWIWMVVGSFSLAIGNLMPKSLFPIGSNAGEILMMICILRMFREVHHDLWQGTEMQDFIRPPSNTNAMMPQTPSGPAPKSGSGNVLAPLNISKTAAAATKQSPKKRDSGYRSLETPFKSDDDTAESSNNGGGINLNEIALTSSIKADDNV